MKPPRIVIVWEPALIAAIVEAVDKGFGVSALPAEARAIIVKSVAGSVLDALRNRALPECPTATAKRAREGR